MFTVYVSQPEMIRFLPLWVTTMGGLVHRTTMVCLRGPAGFRLRYQNGFYRSTPAVTDCHCVLPDRWSCGECETVFCWWSSRRHQRTLLLQPIETNTLGLLVKYTRTHNHRVTSPTLYHSAMAAPPLTLLMELEVTKKKKKKKNNNNNKTLWLSQTFLGISPLIVRFSTGISIVQK